MSEITFSEWFATGVGALIFAGVAAYLARTGWAMWRNWRAQDE